MPVYPSSAQYQTHGGLIIRRQVTPLAAPAEQFQHLCQRIDQHHGMVMACDVTQTGRYRPAIMGFSDPPLRLTGQDRTLTIQAMNQRGQILLVFIRHALGALATNDPHPQRVTCPIPTAEQPDDEDQRTKQNSLFTPLRRLLQMLYAPQESHLGLYGCFGYDLVQDFDPIRLRLPRPQDQRDMVLFLPDHLMLMDFERQDGVEIRYDFAFAGQDSRDLPRQTPPCPMVPGNQIQSGQDHPPGAYAQVVKQAIEHFRCGNLFEVVPSQSFSRPCIQPPSQIFQHLRHTNPAPYGLLVNLGESEALIAASPEMYVRCQGQRVETAPISGTAPRGSDALEDHANLLALLNNDKEAAELTMCTDVDRNDKARICQPGSVRIIGRRQVEAYSRLFHTVDHVEGQLRPGYDAVDAFLTHAWAVTVTGAPKKWARQFIEDHEQSPRRWYGGAFGGFRLDGSLDSGLTIRAIHLQRGQATVRAGATLLLDSDPKGENAECHLKASALLALLEEPAITTRHAPPSQSTAPLSSPQHRVLLVDHEDSFVHTLADYLRQAGCVVRVVRHGKAVSAVRDMRPDLLVLSPGPGCPDDFHIHDTIATALDHKIAIFGICLGLQAIGEFFGGQLITDQPIHGKPACIHVTGGAILADLPSPFTAARYHSMHVERTSLPACLNITAQLENGMIMALEHQSLPVAGVQFHPESLLTLQNQHGHRLIQAMLRHLIPMPEQGSIPHRDGRPQ